MFIVQIPPVDTLSLMELSRAVEPKPPRVDYPDR